MNEVLFRMVAVALHKSLEDIIDDLKDVCEKYSHTGDINPILSAATLLLIKAHVGQDFEKALDVLNELSGRNSTFNLISGS